MSAQAMGHNTGRADADADSLELQELAGKIRLELFAIYSIGQHIRDSRKRARSHQIEAGRLLLEARARLAAEQPGGSFERWCERNTGHGYRHCRRCMGYARNPDRLRKDSADRSERRRRQRERDRKAKASPALTEFLATGGLVDGQGGCPPPSGPAPGPRPAAATFLTRRDAKRDAESESDNPTENETTAVAAVSDSQDHECSTEPPKRRTVRPRDNKRYTAEDCTEAVVRHIADQFNKDDNFADPCYGEGPFARAIIKITGKLCDGYEIDPETQFVKRNGVLDFLDCTKHYTWGITNPAWALSKKNPPERDSYTAIFSHALKVCDNIVFLVRVQNATTSKNRETWEAAGFGLKEIAYVKWEDAGFPHEGYPLAAMHWQRGYVGDVRESKIAVPKPTPAIREIEAEVAELSDNTKGKLAALLDRIIHPTTTTFDIVRSARAFRDLSHNRIPSQIWPLREGKSIIDAEREPRERQEPRKRPEYGTPEYEEYEKQRDEEFEDTIKRANNIFFHDYKQRLEGLRDYMKRFSSEQQEELRAIMASMFEDEQVPEAAE